MGRRIKVKLQDSTPARVIFLDEKATEGATLGENVYIPGGAVGTPASIRAWLGVVAAESVVEQNISGTIHHHLLQGLLEGNDHPQYPLKAGTETISGQWNFTQQVRAADGTDDAPAYSFEGDRDNGMYLVGANNVGMATGGDLRWDVNGTRTYQTVYAHIRNYSGLFIENPDYLNAGIELTTITGLDPHNNGIGNMIGLWEVGTGGAFTDRSYGFHIRQTGEVTNEGNLDWYRHTNSVPGILFLRMTREASQIQFADGTAGDPVISFIGDQDSGIYQRVSSELNFSTANTERLRITTAAILPQFPVRVPTTNSATAPTYSFDGDENTGIYRSAADTLAMTTGGTLRWSMTTALITSTLPIQLPTLDLGSTTDTTLSRASAGVLAVEGHNVTTVDQAQTISARYNFSVAPIWSNVVTPSQIVGNVDNYAPTGITDVSHLRLSTDASRQISGITSGVAGRFIFVTNIGAFNITLPHDNSGSSVGNRFWLEGGSTVTIEPDQTRIFWFDATTNYWRLLMAGAGGGSGTVDSVVAGDGIDVDATDPANPIVTVDIIGLTQDSTPDSATDFVMTWDDSASALKKVLLDDLPGGGGGSGQVVRFDFYTADDTWNKPTGFAFGLVIGIGQGGGGASGRLGVAGGGRVGGGGGGGGGRSVLYIQDADIGSSAAINVNGGGTGGAARTTTAQDGANGVAGESTTFGAIFTAGGGGGGTGGTNTGNAAAGTGGTGNAGNGSTGGLGYATAVQTPAALGAGSTGAGGGCGGAGVTAGNADGQGGAGAAGVTAAGGIAPAGSPPGGNGGAGGSGNGYNDGGGGGGSGNGSDVSTTLGGDGGNGGDYGGGGGGGAGSTLLTTVGESGQGGNGGSGFLAVISWMNVGAGTGLVDSVVAGDGIDVDNSDPTNPIVAVDQTFAFTWSGIATFTGSPSIIIDRAAATNRTLRFSTAGSIRWDIRVDAQAEAGSNVGSALDIVRYDDAGSSIGNALTIDRATGQWEFGSNTLNTPAVPAVAWHGDADTGFYRPNANQVGIAAGGIDGVIVTSGAVELGTTAGDHQIRVPAVNDAATPTFCFLSDTDTGFYRIGANNVGFAANAALVFQYGSGFIDHVAAIRETGIISPAQLVANTNNWNPTGLASCSVIRVSTDVSRNLTGIVAQSSGTRITICNIGTTDLVLVHNATSTATNQFLCPGSANFTLNANDSVDIWRDTTSDRWRVVAY